jgi:hypothetical protein
MHRTGVNGAADVHPAKWHAGADAGVGTRTISGTADLRGVFGLRPDRNAAPRQVVFAYRPLAEGATGSRGASPHRRVQRGAGDRANDAVHDAYRRIRSPDHGSLAARHAPRGARERRHVGDDVEGPPRHALVDALDTERSVVNRILNQLDDTSPSRHVASGIRSPAQHPRIQR